MLRVVLAQLNPTVGAFQNNVELVLRAMQHADSLGASLLLTPELVLTGYPPEDLLLRHDVLDRCDAALARLQAASGQVAVVVGHPRRADGRLFNSASVLQNGRCLGTYDKQLLPNYGVFDERRYFATGQMPLVVEVAGARCGITVCEDIWGEAPARLAAQAGAEILLNLNASPYHRDKTGERLAVLQQRTGELGLPILYCNMVGGQDELVFDGASMAVAGDGTLRLLAPAFAEGLHTVDFERDAAGRWQATTGPLQPPAADDLATLYRALCVGVRDYVNKNGFRGAIVGLSGGIDSALVLALAADALGADCVEAVSMPSRYTAGMSNDDARAEALALGVAYRLLPIEQPFQSFLDLLAPVFAGLPADSTEENLQARCRGMILMALSNKSGKLVLTTSNKSESAVGYATLYGDMAGGFAPLRDVPKTLVYALAAHRNSVQPVIPQRVFERPPSAELRPDQTDQDSLPAYDVLDAILQGFVEQDRSIDDIVGDGYDRPTVERVARLVIASEHKRRQAAPGVRLTPRAFGRDRRYPITSGYRG